MWMEMGKDLKKNPRKTENRTNRNVRNKFENTYTF